MRTAVEVRWTLVAHTHPRNLQLMQHMTVRRCAEVDFTEFYEWWTNPKKTTTLQGNASTFFEIEPH